MITETTVPAKRCECDVCGRKWTLYEDTPVPLWCRNQDCRSREWNGKKQHIQLHINEIKFPAPRTSGRPKTITAVDYGEEP